MEQTGAQIIVSSLERRGITTVCGIPGGANLPLYDALAKSSVRHVLARHEQGAAFIAQGMARVTGRAAVCLGTSGPGATNLVSAIADAKMDSVPLIAITGQVPRALIGTDAFQEVDTCAMMRPIAKRVYFAARAADLVTMLPEAFAVAESGRAGPVVIDVPKDVQLETAEFDDFPAVADRNRPPQVGSSHVVALAQCLNSAERPVFLIGGGVIASGASALVTELARRTSSFVASTLNGLGAFPPDDELALGMIGMHGAPATNHALEEADLLIALGARFDDRATGKVSDFCKNARIVHVDIDPREIGKNKPVHLGLVGDVADVVERVIAFARPRRRRAWRRKIARLRRKHPMPSSAGSDGTEPLAIVRALARSFGPETIVTTDVGQHQMWIAQSYPFAAPRTLLTSGGLGTMGFGLPAAIGAALSSPGTKVLCVTGDGSLLMNIQELATLRELDLDVTVVVWNNRHLGLVRQQQELFYSSRFHACRFPSDPDFAAIARGFGVASVDLDDARDPLGTLAALVRRRGPLLVNLPVAAEYKVLPMVAPGASNREMIGAEPVVALPPAGPLNTISA